MVRKVLYIVGGLLVTAVFAAAAVFGVMSYNLKNQLTQSQADHQALQSDYDALSAEYTQAQADFKAQSEQAAAELSKTNTELTAAQEQAAALEGDLKKAQAKNAKLETQMTEIQSKVDILNSFWFMSQSAFERRMKATGDEQLQSLYEKLEASNKWNDFVNLMSYMIEGIADASDVH